MTFSYRLAEGEIDSIVTLEYKPPGNANVPDCKTSYCKNELKCKMSGLLFPVVMSLHKLMFFIKYP
ncbi:MAG: hypothetical protein QG670_2483 [Thermoproteota archaeon]|nr:hypothetical protein [Thermoproteota archaeon]